MMGLTPRQRDCFNLIRAHVKEQGVAPTFDKLAHLLELPSRSRGRAHQLVAALIERGYLAREGGRLKLVEPDYDHGPQCRCPRCPARRFQYQQLIQGLQRDPEFAQGIRLSGLRLLSSEKRAALLGQSVNAAPRTRTALPREAS